MSVIKNNKNYGTRVILLGEPPVPPTPTGDYFYVEDASGADNTLSIKGTNATSIEVFCSTDKQNWTSMGITSSTAITATIPANGRLYLKANVNAWGISGYNNNITASGNHNVGGNIMSLLYGDNYQTNFLTNNTYAFYSVFKNNTTLINAENLVLPYNTVGNCYYQMFQNCTALTAAPELPATTLAQSCYNTMFYGCTSLTAAPELPATTLANSCYYQMFYNCTALTAAPELPATTLTIECYYGMFWGCTGLTTAPVLPATTLIYKCYQYMFQNCTSLTTAPALPATTLAQNCYYGMFNGCTSLTTAPELPATTLTYQCYYIMFKGCSNLVKVTTYATDISATQCLNNWMQNVSATGDFYNLGGATYPRGTSGIPSGWTEHNSL